MMSSIPWPFVWLIVVSKSTTRNDKNWLCTSFNNNIPSACLEQEQKQGNSIKLSSRLESMV